MRLKGLIKIFAVGVILSFVAVASPPATAQTMVPEAGKSKKIDAIKERGALRVAAIGEFPWLPENTTGSGPQFSGPVWVLAEEYAERLGVTIEVVSVSHETKVPILATDGADMTIAPLAVTESRKKVVEFVIYSKSALCVIGLASNPKLANATSWEDFDSPDITMAYFTGTPPETWAPSRFPNMKVRAVPGSGANVPIEEIMAKRADIAPVDSVAWPKLDAAVPGLIAFPKGDDCLRSTEEATPIGLAIDKGDAVFLDWLQATAKEVMDKVEAEELRILKSTM